MLAAISRLCIREGIFLSHTSDFSLNCTRGLSLFSCVNNPKSTHPSLLLTCQKASSLSQNKFIRSRTPAPSHITVLSIFPFLCLSFSFLRTFQNCMYPNCFSKHLVSSSLSTCGHFFKLICAIDDFVIGGSLMRILQYSIKLYSLGMF